MTVLTTSIITLKPGRFEEYREIAVKAKSIVEGIGAKNVRLFGGFYAGEQTGTLALTMEYDDFAAAGESTDKAIANPEIRAMLSSDPDGPMVSYQTSQWIEVPL